MKTDLQKFQDLFDELNIEYGIWIGCTGNKYIDVNSIHLIDNYGATLYIRFDDNEKFVKFETWGE